MLSVHGTCYEFRKQARYESMKHAMCLWDIPRVHEAYCESMRHGQASPAHPAHPPAILKGKKSTLTGRAAWPKTTTARLDTPSIPNRVISHSYQPG